MGDLTPFQNQVLDHAAMAEKREKEEQRQQAKQGNGRRMNARSDNGGGSHRGGDSDISREETVRYVNKEENPNHDIHNS